MTDISAGNLNTPVGRLRNLALPLTAITLFLSAFLLFSVQPFFAKLVLPRLGGSPAVWSVAMVFFQSVLLAGYAYAHLLTSRLPLKLAVAVHAAVLIIAALALPIAIPGGWDRAPADGQAFWLIGLFAVSVGLPFFAVSANGPLLQAWFARTGHGHAKDPYFLYGASNIGSFASLILYVVLIEPFFDLSVQSSSWSIGFFALGALIVACGVTAVKLGGNQPLPMAAANAEQRVDPAAVWRERLIWTGCAFLPSALLVAVTAHVSTDVAAVPFLWIVPLALFLLTFVIVFQNKPLISQRVAEKLTPLLVIPMLFLSLVAFQLPIIIKIVIYFSAFFVVALCAHGMLAARRPPSSRLTEFYFAMSIGGVLGGVFSSFVAMYLFSWIAEYPLLLLASLLTVPALRGGNPARGFSTAAIAACVIVAGMAALDQVSPITTVTGLVSMSLLCGVFAVCALYFLWRNPQLSVQFCFLMFFSAFAYQSFFSNAVSERSFFGVVKIVDMDKFGYRKLVHGTTLHGATRLSDMAEGSGRPMPLTYYGEQGGLSIAIAAARQNFGGELPYSGVIGVGAGSLACRFEPGEKMDFYEIDPSVARIAADPKLFRFLSACGQDTKTIIGDGRIEVADVAPGAYGILAVDAFSSDSIPVHLMTREFVELFMSKVQERGILVMHISNRHLELATVISAIGKSLGLEVRVGSFKPESRPEMLDMETDSKVAVLARSEAALGVLLNDVRWEKVDPGSTKPWTDGYSNVLAAMIRQYSR